MPGASTSDRARLPNASPDRLAVQPPDEVLEVAVGAGAEGPRVVDGERRSRPGAPRRLLRRHVSDGSRPSTGQPAGLEGRHDERAVGGEATSRRGARIRDSACVRCGLGRRSRRGPASSDGAADLRVRPRPGLGRPAAGGAWSATVRTAGSSPGGRSVILAGVEHEQRQPRPQLVAVDVSVRTSPRRRVAPGEVLVVELDERQLAGRGVAARRPAGWRAQDRVRLAGRPRRPARRGRTCAGSTRAAAAPGAPGRVSSTGSVAVTARAGRPRRRVEPGRPAIVSAASRGRMPGHERVCGVVSQPLLRQSGPRVDDLGAARRAAHQPGAASASASGRVGGLQERALRPDRTAVRAGAGRVQRSPASSSGRRSPDRVTAKRSVAPRRRPAPAPRRDPTGAWRRRRPAEPPRRRRAPERLRARRSRAPCRGLGWRDPPVSRTMTLVPRGPHDGVVAREPVAGAWHAAGCAARRPARAACRRPTACWNAAGANGSVTSSGRPQAGRRRPGSPAARTRRTSVGGAVPTSGDVGGERQHPLADTVSSAGGVDHERGPRRRRRAARRRRQPASGSVPLPVFRALDLHRIVRQHAQRTAATSSASSPKRCVERDADGEEQDRELTLCRARSTASVRAA